MVETKHSQIHLVINNGFFSLSKTDKIIVRKLKTKIPLLTSVKADIPEKMFSLDSDALNL